MDYKKITLVFLNVIDKMKSNWIILEKIDYIVICINVLFVAVL